MIRRYIPPILAILILGALGAWYLTRSVEAADNGPLQASGTVEAVEVLVSAESPGQVDRVFFEEGDEISSGDVLLSLDDSILSTQRRRAVAALEAAQAGLVTAQTGYAMASAGVDNAQASLRSAEIGLEAARIQYHASLRSAYLTHRADRITAWGVDAPDEFSLPVWYFAQSEDLAFAQTEVESAAAALEIERANLERVLQNVSQADLLEAENRLGRAQTAFQVAQMVLEQAQDQNARDLEDFAQTNFEAAQAELGSAQAEYDRMLSQESTDEVLEARARLAVARERFNSARDHLHQLLVGDQSLQVQAAEVGVRQAEAAVDQGRAGLAQAQAILDQAEAQLTQAEKMETQIQAELELIDIQMDKLNVAAPASGVIMTRSVEPGEVVGAGGALMTIARLADLTITVFIPEDRYGRIELGQSAEVTADSFPDEVFSATVVRIADQGEFTPRNVQTEEGRRTTVFAVELSVSNPQGKLKPGMPADVLFIQ